MGETPFRVTGRSTAGAINGELELLTRVTPDGGAVEAMVRYAGAPDLYTVSGGPVHVVSERPRPGGASCGTRAHPGGADDASEDRGRQRDASGPVGWLNL
jgi:hypothetical protein